MVGAGMGQPATGVPHDVARPHKRGASASSRDLCGAMFATKKALREAEADYLRLVQL